MTQKPSRTRRPIAAPIVALAALLALPPAEYALRAHAAPAAPPAQKSSAPAPPPAKAAPAREASPVPDSAAAMHLVTEKRGQAKDAQGRAVEVWTLVTAQTVVQAGDVLRCTVQIGSRSPRPIQNFVLTLPVPPALSYVANSAAVRGVDGVQITFRADGSDAFQAVPTVSAPQPDGSVKTAPAPPAAFRAVRWAWTKPLLPGQTVEASFREEVR